MQYIQHIRNTHSINRDSRLSSNHVNDELISRDVSSLDICPPIRIVFLFNDNIDEWREMAEFDGLIGRNLSAERNVDYPEVNLENRWIKDRPEQRTGLNLKTGNLMNLCENVMLLFSNSYDLFLSLDVTRWICKGYIFYGKVIREVFTYISTFCWKLVRRSIKRATNFHAIFTRLVASRSGITLVLVLREWFTIRNPEGVRPVSFFSSFIPNALQDYNLELKRPLNELFFAYFRREKRTREKRRVS